MDDARKIGARGRAGDSDAGTTRRKQRRSADAAEGARLPVSKTYKLYINGKFPRTESGRYYPFESNDGTMLANICRGSRKDFREAVVAARGAQGSWSQASAFLRGQILYRVAEMLEGRSEQFVTELVLQGLPKKRAQAEVVQTIDRLVYYAGWTDKFQQIFSSVNPVNSAHFNFSMLEPMGVVSILAPETSALLGLVSTIVPAIAGGNSCVVLASQRRPLTAISFAEVLHASDVPPGVVNLLTGYREELAEHFASHMDVNAVIYCDDDGDLDKQIQHHAAGNIKRVVSRTGLKWNSAAAQGPYFIKDTQETKTTWHPIGN